MGSDEVPAGEIGAAKAARVVLSPGFLSALLLLVVNDAVLKWDFPGLVTGKLSDFAGLFAFSLFLMAFLPRSVLAVCASTALAFALWKSSLSEPFLRAWNDLDLLPIGRVVDPTDLLALAVLPFAAAYRRSCRPLTMRRPALLVVSVVSVLAFTATSFLTQYHFDTEYEIGIPRAVLLQKLAEGGCEVRPALKAPDTEDPRYETGPWRESAHDFDITIPSDICRDTLSARVTIIEEGANTTLILRELTHRCKESKGDREIMWQVFREKALAPLRASLSGRAQRP